MFLSNYFQKRALKKSNDACLNAAYRGDFQTVLGMVDQGTDVNLTGTATRWLDHKGNSLNVPMCLGFAAIIKRNAKALEALLNRNMNANIVLAGKPLLMHALEARFESGAEMLLAHGARSDYIRQDLETPLSLAEKHGFVSVASRIKGGQLATKEAGTPRLAKAVGSLVL